MLLHNANQEKKFHECRLLLELKYCASFVHSPKMHPTASYPGFCVLDYSSCFLQYYYNSITANLIVTVDCLRKNRGQMQQQRKQLMMLI